MPVWIRPLIVPIVALLFYVLPLKVPKQQLLSLAFGLWLVGGLMLMLAGIDRLTTLQEIGDPVMFYGAIGLALIIGLAKGKMILGKTSKRNIERIAQFTAPQKLIQVYSVRSWIVIGIMLLLSASLTILNAPIFWRGVINLGVGAALLMSCFDYVGALKKPVADSTSF